MYIGLQAYKVYAYIRYNRHDCPSSDDTVIANTIHNSGSDKPRNIANAFEY